MKKQILPMLLAGVMLISLLSTPALAENVWAAAELPDGTQTQAVPPVGADGAVSEEQAAAERLYSLGLFRGTGADATGAPVFELEAALTREQAVVMLVRLLGGEAEALAGGAASPFTDVSGWARPYVDWAYARGLANGTGGTTFDAQTQVTAAQYVTFVLRALGYSSQTDFAWDAPWELAAEIGLVPADNAELPADTALLRGGAAVVSASALGIRLCGSGMTLSESLFGQNGDTAAVPVLMYHHIAEPGDGDATISPELFREHISALAENGYTAVMPDDLARFVSGRGALPEKPVVITFDDGYLSNYELAWPVLAEYGMCATVFVVGSSVGASAYKDTGVPIIPHFTYEQAAEMVASGLISIQSHTHDMHQSGQLESDPARVNVLSLPGESVEDYRAALEADCRRIRGDITENTGERSVHVFAYPGGAHDGLCREILLENGFDISFTTQFGLNTLVRGAPETLLELNRFNMCQTVSAQTMLEWITVP